MPLGGTLTLSTEELREEETHGPTVDGPLAPGRWVRLDVSDTGTGMDEATRERIFEPFFTTKAPGAGTGLGLSMVYGIVKQSHGYIQVETAPGAGATFTLYFPQVEAEDAYDAVADRGAEHAGAETILVAEDDAGIRGIARRTLTAAGYHILEAADGEEALRLASGFTGEIHLLVTDAVMPGLRGRELAERVQAVRPGIRVLFVSGYMDERGEEELHHPFLSKPFTPEGLKEAVRHALEPGGPAG
jgi:CheY-like chemotaxis protein